MEDLTKEEAAFFSSGGKEEIPGGDSETVETVVETPAEVEVKTEVKAEVKTEEKKRPSKFDYSPDTDNVTDDLGRKYVPLGAVQEARNENKTLRRELDELKGKWGAGEQKLEKLMKAISGEQVQAPDPEKDPLGHLKHKNAELEAKIQALSESDEKRGQESEQSKKLQEFSSNVQAAERAFASKTPDYAEAVSKVQEVWRAEYEASGMPEQFIEHALARKGAQFTYAAMSKEQNPAEAVYKLAQRYGYKKAEVKQEANKDKDKLKQIAEGQKAEKSLAGGKGSVDFSLDAVASMSDEEIDEFVKDPKNWKKLSKAA